jgi:hypothetical protein
MVGTRKESSDPYLEVKIMNLLSIGIDHYEKIAQAIGTDKTTVSSAISRLAKQKIVQKKDASEESYEDGTMHKGSGRYEFTESGKVFFSFFKDHMSLNIDIKPLNPDSIVGLPLELNDWFEYSRRQINETKATTDSPLEAGLQHQTILHSLIVKSIPNNNKMVHLDEKSHKTSPEELTRLLHALDIGIITLGTALDMLKTN